MLNKISCWYPQLSELHNLTYVQIDTHECECIEQLCDPTSMPRLRRIDLKLEYDSKHSSDKNGIKYWSYNYYLAKIVRVRGHQLKGLETSVTDISGLVDILINANNLQLEY